MKTIKIILILILLALSLVFISLSINNFYQGLFVNSRFRMNIDNSSVEVLNNYSFIPNSNSAGGNFIESNESNIYLVSITDDGGWKSYIMLIENEISNTIYGNCDKSYGSCTFSDIKIEKELEFKVFVKNSYFYFKFDSSNILEADINSIKNSYEKYFI